MLKKRSSAAVDLARRIIDAQPRLRAQWPELAICKQDLRIVDDYGPATSQDEQATRVLACLALAVLRVLDKRSI